MGTAIKHPVPDRVKPSFVILDIRALWCSGLRVRVPGCQKLQITAQPSLAHLAVLTRQQWVSKGHSIWLHSRETSTEE